MRLLMKIVWADLRDGLNADMTEIEGYIVVVWIKRNMNHTTLLSS